MNGKQTLATHKLKHFPIMQSMQLINCIDYLIALFKNNDDYTT